LSKQLPPAVTIFNMNMSKRSHTAVIGECKVIIEIAHRSYQAGDRSLGGGEELFLSLASKCSEIDYVARQVITKFRPVSSEATQRSNFRAIFKIIWRYIRDKSVNPERRFLLMMLAFSTLTVGARKASKCQDEVDKWRNEIANWIGCHLSSSEAAGSSEKSSGKKSSSSGSGNLKERAQKLFSTAYLPSFD